PGDDHVALEHVEDALAATLAASPQRDPAPDRIDGRVGGNLEGRTGMDVRVGEREADDATTRTLRLREGVAERSGAGVRARADGERRMTLAAGRGVPEARIRSEVRVTTTWSTTAWSATAGPATAG